MVFIRTAGKFLSFSYELILISIATKLQSSTLQIFELQDQLFDFLKIMLLWLLHHDETDNEVWGIALNSIMYFIVTDGIVDKAK